MHAEEEAVLQSGPVKPNHMTFFAASSDRRKLDPQRQRSSCERVQIRAWKAHHDSAVSDGPFRSASRVPVDRLLNWQAVFGKNGHKATLAGSPSHLITDAGPFHLGACSDTE